MSHILASIETVSSLEPLEGLNNLMKATILGWQVLVNKDHFQEGDLAVFHHPDTIVDKVRFISSHHEYNICEFNL